MVLRTAWPALLILTIGLAWLPSLATAALVKPALAYLVPGAPGGMVGFVRTLIWRATHSLLAAAATAIALSRLANEPRIEPRHILKRAIRAAPIILAYSLALDWNLFARPWLGPLADRVDSPAAITVTVAATLTPFAAAPLLALLTPAAVAETGRPGRAIARALSAIRGFRWPILVLYLLVRAAETQTSAVVRPIVFAAIRPELGSVWLTLGWTVASFPARLINLVWIVFLAAAYFSQTEIQSRSEPAQVAEVFD